MVEGRYEQIELRNQSCTRDHELRQPLEDLKSGAAAQGQELEHSLQLPSDIPGVQAKGTLPPSRSRQLGCLLPRNQKFRGPGKPGYPWPLTSRLRPL